MSNAFTKIDLSRLSAPGVVEALDYEVILAEMLADLQSRDPEFTALLESDPAYKILEVAAYRETLLRQRVNDAARAVMLAYAGGSDLDHLAALFGVERLLVDPGDPEASPPVEATYESDDRLRSRVQLSLEGYTTAGSTGSYHYHALSASADVADVSVMSPEPGRVRVHVMAADGDGTPSSDLLAVVEAALTAGDVRPLTDQVEVAAAEVVPYTVTAVLWIYAGPDQEVVRLAAEGALLDYAAGQHKLGRDVTMSGIYRALHQDGVQRVDLSAPAADLVIGGGQVSRLAEYSVTVGGIDE